MEVNIHVAKTQLSKLLAEVALGEEVIIARAGKPVAKLVAVESTPKAEISSRMERSSNLVNEWIPRKRCGSA